MSEKREINEYLFYEFGFDIEEEEVRIREDFPYELSFIGEFKRDEEQIKVYEFRDERISNVVLYGNGISVYEKEEMELEDLYFQTVGSAWIGEKNIVDLNTSKIGYDNIPSLNVRRLEIEKLVIDSCHLKNKPTILEGLFFVESQQYLALVESGEEKIVIGLGIVEYIHKFKGLSHWRLLSWAVGRLINNGVIK